MILLLADSYYVKEYDMGDPIKPYQKLGAIIEAARKVAGIVRQSDLASKLGASQQAVSRWEAGTSRPRQSQVPALARILELSTSDLMVAGNYGAPAESLPETVTVSFDQDFPIDALSPESFERLVEDVLRLRNPDAREVRRAGTRGHDQGGIDIVAVLADGRYLTVQCKRVTRFGPADVEAAIKAHSYHADIRILALSRVASPQTAAAVRGHFDWVLWDKQDLSRFIRELDKPQQIRLVDTYFPGQRVPLLGIRASGPWQHPEEFFAPFAARLATFRHDWALVGRRDDVDALIQKVKTGRGRIVFVEGRGGVGKSRLLKEIVTSLSADEPQLGIFFLSPTEQVTAASLEDLGRHPKLLIVDDAHDRSDLPTLFDYAAKTAFDVRILISTRPYATARLRAQAGQFALADAIDLLSISPLSPPGTLTLARDVLQAYGGAPELAEPIARATSDCPLVTVMAARIAATDKLPPALAMDTDSFRVTILGKFQKVITGEIAGLADQKPIGDIMQVIALVQPFGIDDQSFRDLVIQVTGIEDHVVSRLLRLLAEGGVIFRRGSLYRLMPDLLGDYIIEQSCVDTSGNRLNSLADKVFGAAPRQLLGNVLVNLGRLDWRKNGGDVTKSHLVDHLWRALRVQDEYGDPALEAAAAAAYYAPRQALDFVEHQIELGSRRSELGRILRNVAYHLEFLRRACELLWELGSEDKRDQGVSPEHGIRVLSELVAVEPDKPIAYNREAIEFGLSLLQDPLAFERMHTPFDFLKGILSGEGHVDTSDGRTLTMSAFAVNYEAVKDLRTQVIDAGLSLLTGTSVRQAVLAAKFLQHALRYPMGLFGQRIEQATRNQYAAEFRDTLEKLHKVVVRRELDQIVVIAVADAISWHANYADSSTRVPAREIMAALPTDLKFRTLCVLADGWGRVFLGQMDATNWQDRVSKWISDLSVDLSANFSDPSDLFSFLESCLERLLSSGLNSGQSSHALLEQLLLTRPDFTRYVVESAVKRPDDRMVDVLGTALHFLYRTDVDAGREWAPRLFDTGNIRFQVAVARACGAPILDGGTLAPADFSLLTRILSSPVSAVVENAANVFYSLGEANPRFALDMLRYVNFQSDIGLLDRILMVFHSERSRIFAALTEADVEYLFGKLRETKELTGYWIETLLSHLSYYFPGQTLRFLMDRVELSAQDEKLSGMRAVNYGPWVHVPMRFRETERFHDLLEILWNWLTLKDADNWRFRHSAAELFEVVALPIDAVTEAFLKAKAAIAGLRDLGWIASFLRQAPHNLVFTNADFVLSFLETCDRAGRAIRRKVIHDLFASSISGVRTSRLGEPSDEDLRIIKLSSEIMSRLSRASSAYELYQMIHDHAQRNITMAKFDAESLDGG